jgi:PTS system nitrogen regulatory IIA component
MDLKIKDVANLLNVSETTVRRWLTEGKIPAYRINHQYRFSRGELQNWVMSHKLGGGVSANPFVDVANTKESFESDELQEPPLKAGNQQYSLYRAIYRGGIYHDIEGSGKEEIIRNATQRIAGNLHLDADVLSELLWDRERLQPTALNNGIGIPHTRDFLLKKPYDVIAIVFPPTPIDYGALDGQPVHTLFFLFASEDKSHLHLLAKIALFCSQAETIEFFSRKPSRQEVLSYIKEWESNMIQKTSKSHIAKI